MIADSKKDSTEDLNDRVVDDSAPVEDESSTTECKEVKVEEVEDEKLKVDDIALTNGGKVFWFQFLSLISLQFHF